VNTNKQRILIVSLLFLLVGSCAAYTAVDLPTRAPAQDDYMLEQSIERGALLYANNCRTCHGNSGEGYVGPAINTEAWKNQDPVVLEENRRILTRTLQCGRAGTLMPAWLAANGGALNVRQIEQLVNFLTAPYEEDVLDEFGEPSNVGWNDALEFAHNLNHALTALVSGDTLSSIAEQHNIGPGLLAAENGMTAAQVNDVLERGSKIRVPANSVHPDGSTHQIRADNDTIAKLAKTLNVGAAAIADLNGLKYDLNYKAGTITLLDDANAPLTGLMPGEVLELPEGASYRVTPNDTIEAIAEKHGLSASGLLRLNRDLLGADVDVATQLDGKRRLELPGDPIIALVGGETLASLAELYSVEAADIADENDLASNATLEAGQQIAIPAGARYVVQEGDTLEGIAQRHGIDAAALATENAIADPASFSHVLVLNLPKVDAFVVEGQTMTEVAAGYGSTSAQAFADANDIASVDEVLRVGTVLVLPESSTGTAAPDAINQGTACVQYAVSQSGYETLLGTNFDPQTPPEEFSDEVVIQAHSNDWTVVADGTAQEPNLGIVKVRPDTTVLFENMEPVLHTVTVDGTTEEPAFGPAVGYTFEYTFGDPARYVITCDFHPDMLAYLFVEEE